MVERRIQHEAESEEALVRFPYTSKDRLLTWALKRHIGMSSAMHDTDLAVERGRAGPELTSAKEKRADIANLELVVSRVSDEACTASLGGGVLRQLKDFNVFLERAAMLLEEGGDAGRGRLAGPSR